jgi:hypothetical protein
MPTKSKKRKFLEELETVIAVEALECGWADDGIGFPLQEEDAARAPQILTEPVFEWNLQILPPSSSAKSADGIELKHHLNPTCAPPSMKV